MDTDRAERLRILKEEAEELKAMAEDLPDELEESVPALMRMIRENEKKQAELAGEDSTTG